MDLQEELGVYEGTLPTRKIDRNGRGPVPTIDPASAADILDRDAISVTGSTVWQLLKKGAVDLEFDAVVIDEGSQVKVAEAAIPIRRLRAAGRLLIAGDDKQLAPILQGRYPRGDGEPLLHRSILECLRDRDPSDAIVTPLLENFRMCDVLCEYPRSSIYPSEYGPATKEVAVRRLPGRPDTGSELVDLALDPDHPLVVCVIDGVQATNENVVEAGLVADVTMGLYGLLGEPDDEEFWTERLFVVSPHHAQLRLIRKELWRRKRWDHKPFVDTVDKMQGQECDAVIVSYGVSDVEYALGEKEFIYSLNRMNVSITRARMKTILFISRALLEPPIQALDNDDVADGIAYMQGVARFAEIGAAPVGVNLGAGMGATMLRAGLRGPRPVVTPKRKGKDASTAVSP